jgi:hypothetical protein
MRYEGRDDKSFGKQEKLQNVKTKGRVETERSMTKNRLGNTE